MIDFGNNEHKRCRLLEESGPCSSRDGLDLVSFKFPFLGFWFILKNLADFLLTVGTWFGSSSVYMYHEASLN